MRTLSTLRVRSKLAVVVILMIGGISLFISLYFPHRLAEQETRALTAKARSIAQMTAYSVSAALVFGDRSGAEEALKSAEQNEDVLYIVVLNDTGTIFIAFNQENAAHTVFTRGNSGEGFSTNGFVFQTVTPVLHNDVPIGILRLGISLEQLHAEVSRSRDAVIGVSLIIFILGVLAVLGISAVITGPLNQMVKSVERITEGDLSHRVEVTVQDEVGYLARSVNLMVDNLVAAHTELAKINKNLEERVADRTKALQSELAERIKVEEALHRSRQMLQFVFDNIPQRIFWKDLNLRYLGCNKTFIKDAGLEWTEEVIGKTDYDLAWREMAELYRANDMRVIETDTPMINFDEPMLLNDGTKLWLKTSKVPLHDSAGNVMGVLGTYEDITERRRAEDQIREQAALLGITRDAILVVDLNSRVLFWNKGAERVYGWTEAEAFKMNPVALLHEEGKFLEWDDARKNVMDFGEWTGELHQVTKAGNPVIADSRWTLVRDSAGAPESILIVNSDITEKKQLESQFHRSQRLELIGTLAGGIAHDLNNVLAPITMAIELLQAKVEDDDGRQWLETLASSAQRGADIVKQVLVFARGVEGDRVVLQPKHLLREIETIAMETFPRSVNVLSDIPRDLWNITGDPTQIHQVLMNLTVNARDAMPRGGTLFLRAENALLDEKTARTRGNVKPGRYVAFSVKDTGTGIPMNIIDKIFDPFFTTKDIGKGTGLGLSTVMAIVRGHGGFITVDSKEGRGAEFIFYMPASMIESKGSQAAAAEKGIAGGRGETILVVDDEAPVREITKELLELYGYRVLLAANGAEGLEKYNAHSTEIDLVLTDMMMPVMDGITLISSLRRRNAKVKTIVASGLADAEKLSDLQLSNAAQAFLSKPITAANLLRTVRSVLDFETGTK